MSENSMEYRPINKTSESLPKWMPSPETMTETVEAVPDIAACYTIEVVPDVGTCYTIEVVPEVGAYYTINEIGDYVMYSGSDVASDGDSDRTTTDSSDNELSGYDGDHDIEQGDVSGNGTDSDVESRAALAKKARSILQKSSGGMDSISGMPLESLFEEVCEGLDSDGYLGSSYTDELLSGNEDVGFASFNAKDQWNGKANLTPKELFSIAGCKNSRPVKRKLSCDNEC